MEAMDPVGRSPARRIGWRIVFAGALVSVGLSACKEDAPPAPEPPPPQVSAVRPTVRDVTEYLEYAGNTEALATVDLRARVRGYLEEARFVEGAKVSKGDLLYVIEKAPYQAAVARAEADITARQASLAGAEADARLAAELADQKAGPEIDRVTKAARRDSAAASVAEAEAVLDNAQINLAYCEIHAPVDGIISKSLVDVGNLVGQEGPTQLATIVASKPIYVTIYVSEADALKAKRRDHERAQSDEGLKEPAVTPPGRPAGVGRPVFLSLGDEGSFDREGRIDYIDPAMDQATGTIGVRMTFENADNLLVPGMFVRVRIPVETQQRMVCPATSLMQDQTGFYVYVLGEDGVVARKRVKTGFTDGTDRVVLEGLGAESRVITQGQQRVRVGAKAAVRASESGESNAPKPRPSLEHGKSKQPSHD